LFLTLGFSVRAPRLAVASILGYARRGAPTLARAHCSPGCCGRGNSKLPSPELIVEVEVRRAGSAVHGENGRPIAARGTGNAMARGRPGPARQFAEQVTRGRAGRRRWVID
jgi:hypothetical protein